MSGVYKCMNHSQDLLMLCPVFLSCILVSVYISYPVPDQHGFRPEQPTASALLQLTPDITMGFNQRKPPDRIVYVVTDLLAAFDTVYENNLLLKIKIA